MALPVVEFSREGHKIKNEIINFKNSDFCKLLSPILKIQIFSFGYGWFLSKNLSNFVSLSWKLHNR